jgi:hypothetical protein
MGNNSLLNEIKRRIKGRKVVECALMFYNASAVVHLVS